jgi:predicted PurR-regulated permease PerM
MAKESKSAKQVSGVSLKRQLIFWFVTLAIFVVAFWLLSDVLLPFIVAMGLAYLLDPLVVRLQRLGIPRTFGAIIIVAVAIGLIALAFVLLVPLLGQQLHAFMERLPGYIEKLQKIIADSNQTWLGQYIGEKLPEAQKQLSGIAGQAAGWAATLLGSLLAGGKAVLSALSLIVLAPVIAFFLLLDWDRMVAKIDEWTPRPHRDTVQGL